MLASVVINRIANTLHDVSMERWTPQVHLDNLTSGELEIISARPEAYAVYTAIPLTAGSTRQPLPANVLRVIDVLHNLGSSGATVGKVVRLVPRDLMDAQRPTWHADNAAEQVINCMLDARDPRAMYVYPRPKTDCYLAAVVSQVPPTLVQMSQALNVPDMFANALVEYGLYKAYSIDAEHAASAQLAAAHLQAFTTMIAVKGAVDSQFSATSNSPLKTS